MHKIYCLSGLGADQRVFQFLKIENAALVPIHWVQPITNESLENYTLRLLEQIDTSAPFTLLGVSFGGILAQEIAKYCHPRLIILVSSVKTVYELELRLRLLQKLKIHRLVPTKVLTAFNLITANYYFSIKTKSEAKLLREIVIDTDPKFLRWAINAIMEWKRSNPQPKLVHIHGSKDRIFPIKNIRNSVEIPNAGHFMMVSHANKISEIINELVK